MNKGKVSEAFEAVIYNLDYVYSHYGEFVSGEEYSIIKERLNENRKDFYKSLKNEKSKLKEKFYFSFEELEILYSMYADFIISDSEEAREEVVNMLSKCQEDFEDAYNE